MSGPSAAQVLAKFKKDYGAEIGEFGDEYHDLPRLPTGIFPLDLALGGGLPMGKMSIPYGPESSNKTNLALSTIKTGQLLYPDKKAVFIDAENALDKTWAKKLGVDLDRMITIHPDYAEQAVDIVEAFLHAPDVFTVVLDSIPALITQNEIESSADKQVVAGNSQVIGRMVRKAVHAFGVTRKKNPNGFSPALICINQIRHKIGVMFGDPETFPGGNALRFASSCTLRCYGKNIVDKKINDVMPAAKECSIILKKWKMPILQVNAKYTMNMLALGDLPVGHVEDWNTIYAFLKELGYIDKAKGGYLMFGETYSTIDAMKTKLYSNPKLLMETKRTIIAEMMQAGAIAATTGEEEVESL